MRRGRWLPIAIGLLLPLLGGGNVLVFLEPDDAMRLLGLLAIAAWWALGRRARTTATPARPATVALIVLGCWWLGALALRPSGPRAFLEAQGIFSAMLLYAGFAASEPHRSDLAALAHGLLGAAAVTAIYGQYQYWIMFPRLLPYFQAAKIPAMNFVNANFYNANCYAAFLAATAVLGVGALSEAPGASGRLAIVAGLAAALGTLLLSESRSAFALLAAAVFALFARAGLGRLFRQRSAMLAIALGIPALGVVTAWLVDLPELWRVGTLGRLAIWRGSLALIADHWLLGVGLGRFDAVFPAYRVNSYYTKYPHDFLLEIFGELGIVGFVAAGAFCAAAFRAPLRALLDARTSRLEASVALAAALLLLHALVDIDWHAPANPILLLVLLACAQGFGAGACAPSHADSR